jgi:DNA-binding CsgD family transcriptional regulator
VPSPDPACDPRLSLREREVLDWLAGGKTDRDIADILAISHRTVHKHLQRIYEKLGVENRTSAVMRGISLRQD